MKISLYIALTIWLVAILSAFNAKRMKGKKRHLLKPINILTTGTFLSAAIMFFSVYADSNVGYELGFFNEPNAFAGLFKTVLVSLHQAIKLFIIDCDFDFISEALKNTSGVTDFTKTAFTVFASVLYIFAPILTFGFVLSFFKNTNAYIRYFLSRGKRLYIFSDLNEKSVSFAKSLENEKSTSIVFTSIAKEDIRHELIKKAEELNAICFTKDILSVNLNKKSKAKELIVFVIGDDDESNSSTALELIDKYRNRENTSLYVFAESKASEMILSSAQKGSIKLRIINAARSLVYRSLYESYAATKNPKTSLKLFENAKSLPSGTKKISAVIVGLGKQSKEMLKALTWFCQMDGYIVSIDAFDVDPLAESKLKLECPDLLSSKYNGIFKDGEAKYEIKIHSGYDVKTYEFAKAIKELTDTTYVFVSLGDDDANTETAAKLRTLFLQVGIHPEINAIVYNPEKNKALANAKDFNRCEYDIKFTGDINTAYSKNVIMDSELECEAKDIHMKWGSESDFWNYEYNYRSSMASALHAYARRACMPTACAKAQSPNEKEKLAILEHCRWNAYMRTEGYICGCTDDKSRNSLAKMHPNLIEYQRLAKHERDKDKIIATSN